MKKVYILAVIAAVLFGALTYLYLQGVASSSAAPKETATVVVATCDIAPDTTITEDMVKETQVEVSAVQVNALDECKTAIGQRCPAQIVKGEQILSNMLADPEETGVRLSNQLKGSQRAMTVKIETDSSVGGYIQAGDHIDLLGTKLDKNGDPVASSSYTLLKNVKVLRVNEASSEGETPYEYLTLSLSESHCKKLYEYQISLPSGSSADYHAILLPSGGDK